MKRIQKVILGILFILLLLCVMPSVLYGKERLAGVFHLKLNSNQEQLDDPFFYDSMNSQSSQALNDLLESMDQDPLPIWFSFMLDIISFLFIIGTVCFILFLLYRFIRNTCRVFHQDGEDEILFLDVNKKKERAYYHDRKNHDDHYFSANMKIRRRYKKTIRKATKGDPNTCHTPTELEISANLSDSIQVETLHHCYEKARYSKEGCTDEDIHQLK